MKFNIPCEMCGNPAQHKHHKFSQTRKNRKVYKNLLDQSFNIIYLCLNCHLNKSISKFNEIEFRQAGETAGFRMPIAGKSLQFKKFN